MIYMIRLVWVTRVVGFSGWYRWSRWSAWSRTGGGTKTDDFLEKFQMALTLPPFGTFSKIHPFWYLHPSLSMISLDDIYSENIWFHGLNLQIIKKS